MAEALRLDWEKAKDANGYRIERRRASSEFGFGWYGVIAAYRELSLNLGDGRRDQAAALA
jgi:hypothetical protein